MKIAFLGWGSLIWDPRELRIKGKWKKDGAILPIEFARISRDGRLTLVLYGGAEDAQTLWAYTDSTKLSEAIENLREREVIPNESVEKIGFAIVDGRSRCNIVPDDVLENIINWARDQGLDAVVWTDLSSNFQKKTGNDFAEENVISYLKSLDGETLKKAREYVKKAPRQINTRLQQKMIQELGW